jgi:hypothetical protein
MSSTRVKAILILKKIPLLHFVTLSPLLRGILRLSRRGGFFVVCLMQFIKINKKILTIIVSILI